jgi:biotin operon repressor
MRRHRTGAYSQHHRSERNSSNPDTLPYAPLRAVSRRKGITRSPRARTAPTLPVTAAQAEVLVLLTPELQSPKAIADVLGRTSNGVTASLYGLQERGLAEHVYRKGWKLRTDA